MYILLSFSHVWIFVTPQTLDRQSPLSMRFSEQKYWSGLPCPPPGDLPDPGIQPPSPALASRFFTAEPAGKPKCTYASYYYAYRKNYDYSIITRPYYMKMGFLSSSASKESACNAGDPSSTPSSEISPGKGTGYPLQYPWVSLLAQTVGKIPWRRKWQPLHYSCLDTPHGQRSLAGYSPWGPKESDMTEWRAQHSTLYENRVKHVE